MYICIYRCIYRCVKGCDVACVCGRDAETEETALERGRHVWGEREEKRDVSAVVRRGRDAIDVRRRDIDKRDTYPQQQQQKKRGT